MNSHNTTIIWDTKLKKCISFICFFGKFFAKNTGNGHKHYGDTYRNKESQKSKKSKKLIKNKNSKNRKITEFLINIFMTNRNSDQHFKIMTWRRTLFLDSLECSSTLKLWLQLKSPPRIHPVMNNSFQMAVLQLIL